MNRAPGNLGNDALQVFALTQTFLNKASLAKKKRRNAVRKERCNAWKIKEAMGVQKGRSKQLKESHT